MKNPVVLQVADMYFQLEDDYAHTVAQILLRAVPVYHFYANEFTVSENKRQISVHYNPEVKLNGE